MINKKIVVIVLIAVAMGGLGYIGFTKWKQYQTQTAMKKYAEQFEKADLSKLDVPAIYKLKVNANNPLKTKADWQQFESDLALVKKQSEQLPKM